MNASHMSIIYYDDLTHMSEVSLPNLPPIGFVKEMHSFLVFFLYHLVW